MPGLTELTRRTSCWGLGANGGWQRDIKRVVVAAGGMGRVSWVDGCCLLAVAGGQGFLVMWCAGG